MRSAACLVGLLTCPTACVRTSDASDGPSTNEPLADPFSLAVCTPMAFEDLIAVFPPGEVTAPLATSFTLASRSRARCNAVTGCSPWTGGNVLLQNSRTVAEPPRAGFAALVLDASTSSVSLALLARDPSTRVRAQPWAHIPPRVQLSCGSVSAGELADALSCSVTLEAYELDPFEFATSIDDSAYFTWTGRICTDGSYQLVTRLDTPGADTPSNQNQLAIWGRL